jgi:hypothetical protein
MKHSLLSASLCCASVLMLQACNHAPTPHQAPSVGPGAGDYSTQANEKDVLAGEWEYEEDGLVVPLRLDRFGNGTYEFKDGRFRTDILSDHHWKGMWAQQENDREGGFEITLSADYSEGEGRWWYTRIERDTAPTKAGGRFHVMKVQSTVNNQSLPADRSPQ